MKNNLPFTDVLSVETLQRSIRNRKKATQKRKTILMFLGYICPTVLVFLSLFFAKDFLLINGAVALFIILWISLVTNRLQPSTYTFAHTIQWDEIHSIQIVAPTESDQALVRELLGNKQVPQLYHGIYPVCGARLEISVNAEQRCAQLRQLSFLYTTKDQRVCTPDFSMSAYVGYSNIPLIGFCVGESNGRSGGSAVFQEESQANAYIEWLQGLKSIQY